MSHVWVNNGHQIVSGEKIPLPLFGRLTTGWRMVFTGWLYFQVKVTIPQTVNCRPSDAALQLRRLETPRGLKYQFLGLYAKLLIVTITLVMSVCPSVHMEQLDSHWMKTSYFTKYDVWVFFWKSVKKVQVSLKSGKNSLYCMWRPIYILDHISETCSQNENCFMQKL